ncbi:hypothetical protein FA13DRAFT_1798059 [Coprinellus micaceus]|uniref:G domain-containing protein n=1 Tax=Coprinellus micaceus TaxID=71717 RepID=A0A4Y7SNH1_COPMI|nr:hypothetical protein FA13DRAFT_1798059 [Coprinellus micaceus]
MAPQSADKPLDIVLFVIGGNGAGKSTFVNYILDEVGHPAGGDGSGRMKVHEALNPCTLSIQPVRLKPSRGEFQSELCRIVLVDTPGLADADANQHNQLMSNLKDWLYNHYEASVWPRLGIIYVQDMSLAPLDTFTIKLNLRSPGTLSKLIECENVLLATMKWGKLQPKEVTPAEAIVSSWSKRSITGSLRVQKVEYGREGPSGLAAIWQFLAAFDELVPDGGLKDDIVVLVIGPLKSGKSTFVNTILKHCGQPAHMQVGSSLKPTTDLVRSAVIRSHPFRHVNGRRIILVDSPGFLEDDVQDNGIMRLIEKFGPRGVTCGVVYLHDISQDGHMRTAGRVLPQLIENINSSRMLIATTKWDRSFGNEGEMRESELKQKFWSKVLKKGCIVHRHSRLQSSVPGQHNAVDLGARGCGLSSSSGWVPRARHAELTILDNHTRIRSPPPLSSTDCVFMRKGGLKMAKKEPATIDDPVLVGGLETDIVIPIMGQTKAGKSSFINILLGESKMEVGVNMESCTKNIVATVLTKTPNKALNDALSGRRLVLVDTPGFDDTVMGDEEILSRISLWLEASYRKDMLVGGVLYLHDITRDGWSGSSQKNLDLFYKLCGEEAMRQVSFVTTKWGKLYSLEDGVQRVSELKSKFWAPMIKLEASVYNLQPPSPTVEQSKVENSRCPWDIIHELIVSMNARNVELILLIQEELVDKKLLQDTKSLRKESKTRGYSKDRLREQQEKIDDLTQQLLLLKPSMGASFQEVVLGRLQDELDNSLYHPSMVALWAYRL